MRRRRGASTAVVSAAFAFAPAGDAREQAAGCGYDAHVQEGFNRITNLAVVGWTVPYRDLVSTAVQVGSTIAPTGFLDDGTQVAAPATSGPLSIGTTAFPIDAYVYAQVRFQMPARAIRAHPTAGRSRSRPAPRWRPCRRS